MASYTTTSPSPTNAGASGQEKARQKKIQKDMYIQLHKVFVLHDIPSRHHHPPHLSSSGQEGPRANRFDQIQGKELPIPVSKLHGPEGDSYDVADYMRTLDGHERTSYIKMCTEEYEKMLTAVAMEEAMQEAKAAQKQT